MRRQYQPGAAPPSLGRGSIAGLLAGALVGLLAALVSVPLRHIAAVTDRSIVNGVSLTIGAIILWTLGGLLYAAIARRSRGPALVLLAIALLAGVLLTGFIYANAGPLAPYTANFASLAVPLCFLVTLGGALIFLGLVDRPVPLNFAAPAGFVAAAAVAIIVTAADRTPAVHYSFSKVTTASAGSAQQTPSPVPGQAAAPGAATQVSALPTGPMHLTVDSKPTEVAFTIHEKLARLPAPTDSNVKSSAITGDLYLLPSGLSAASPSSFSLDLNTLTSDAPPRDRYIKQFTLETRKFPTATYTITSVEGFPTSYKEGDEVKLTLNGTFKVHDVEKPMSWTGTARYTAGRLEAIMSTDFSMHDYNITPPNNAVAVSEDNVHVDLHLVAVPAPA